MFAECILTEAEVKDLLRIIGPISRPIQEMLNEVKEKFAAKEFLFCRALAALLSSSVGIVHQSS